MGIRLLRGRWRLAAAFMVAPALAFGYYAGDPENLGISVNAALSGTGSVHGRYVPAPAADKARVLITSEAAHLFAAPHKGPRADRYLVLTRSTKGLEPERETRVVKAPVKADMTTTASIPKDAPPYVAALNPRERTAGAPVPPMQSASDFGPESMIPVAERTSASLFLSSLMKPEPVHFSDFNGAQDGGAGSDPVNEKIRPGLKFQGESELEYQMRQRRCLATAIYFEARGESDKGQFAVAQVVMNRVRSSLYPDTICGVVYQGQLRRTGCQFSFTCDGRADVPKDKERWRKANEIAKKVTEGASWLGDIGHATHYHANYVAPRWRRELNKVKQIGTHIFYRVRGEQIEDVLTEQSPARGLALSGSG